MSHGFEYNTYIRWSVYPIFGLVCASTFLHIVVGMIILFPIVKLKRFCGSIIPYLLRYSRFVYRSSLKMGKNGKIYFIGYKIANWHLIPLSFVSTVTLCCVFISFWGSFLLKHSFACDENMDCFVKLSPDRSFEKIKDCHMYLLENSTVMVENPAVVCFRFVFDSSTGFAYAVSFFGVAVAYVHIYNNMLVWLMENSLSTSNKNWAEIIFWNILWFIVLVAPFAFTVLILVAVNSIPIFRDSITKTYDEVLKFTAYIFFIVYSGQFVALFLTWILWDPMQEKFNKKTCSKKTGDEDIEKKQLLE